MGSYGGVEGQAPHRTAMLDTQQTIPPADEAAIEVFHSFIDDEVPVAALSSL